MRNQIGFLMLGIAASACSSSGDSMVGVRSDGMDVECEGGDLDDVQTCTPEDGDDTCEPWKDGGPAVVLWPPNHKLVRFTLDICAADSDCDDDGDDGDGDGGDIIVDSAPLGPSGGVPVAITAITADEPVEVGAGGDGHTGDFDIAIIDDVTFDLRSERQGGGDGRVYRVHFVDADDNAGSCEFLVPHDQRGPFAGAVDSGTAVTVGR